MNRDREHIEFEQEKHEGRNTRPGGLKSLLDGTWLTRKQVVKQMPFIFFLVFLGLVYISNRYHAESLRNRIEELRDQTNELRSEAIFVSAELMKLSRQTEVADEVHQHGLGLKESIEPPKKMVIKKRN